MGKVRVLLQFNESWFTQEKLVLTLEIEEIFQVWILLAKSMKRSFFSFRYQYYYYYHLFLLEFFTSALADGFSLRFEWQQTSSSLKNSSQYSSRSQWYCCFDGLHSFTYFQILQILYQSFGDWNKSTNHNWYTINFMIHSVSVL